MSAANGGKANDYWSRARQPLNCLAFLTPFVRGDPPDAATFDEWTTLQRESGLRDMEFVFDRLSQLETDCGESNEANSTLLRWLAINPLNEEAHRRLIIAFAQTGRRGHALRQFLECRRALVTELGVEPGEETVALQRRVLAGEAI